LSPKELREVFLAAFLLTLQRRCTLGLSARFPTTSLYRVEVSGWDQDENFFVEKTDLEWDEERGKRIRLSHPMRKGAVIFVRLLQPMGSVNGYPIAYQAEPSLAQEDSGAYEVRLVQLHPKAASPVESLT
jgi:hypothetical protein